MKRVFVLRGGAVGDFILTVPALQALRQCCPEAILELAAYPRFRRLALEYGLAAVFHSLEQAEAARLFAPPQAPEFGVTASRPPSATGIMGRIATSDLVVCYLHDPDGRVRQNLRRAGARKIVYGSPVVVSRHAVDHLLAPLEPLGVSLRGDEKPTLNAPFSLQRWARNFLGECGVTVEDSANRTRFVVLHPGSGSLRKNWPLTRFIELAGRLVASRVAQPVFLLGEAEDTAQETLVRAAPDVPVLSGLDLAEVAAILSLADAYVGNDSGISHLAAAMAIRCVVLFGPTDPWIWGPRGERVTALRAPEPTTEGLARLSVDTVFSQLQGEHFSEKEPVIFSLSGARPDDPGEPTSDSRAAVQPSA